MYNEKIKNEFLNSLPDNRAYRSAYASILNKATPYEKEFQKDLSQFNTEEMQKFMGAFETVKSHTLYSKKSAVKRYIHWCHSMGYIDAAQTLVIDQTKIDFEGNIARGYFFSPQEVADYLELVLGGYEPLSIVILYRAIMWLLFHGITTDDLFVLETKDVDLENRVIHYMGQDIPIYDEAYEDLKLYADHDYYIVTNNRFNVTSKKPKNSGTEFLRGALGTSPLNLQKASTTFNRFATRAGVKIKNPFRKMFVSGEFYKIYRNNKSYSGQIAEVIDHYMPEMASEESIAKLTEAEKDRKRVYKTQLLKDYRLFREIATERGY